MTRSWPDSSTSASRAPWASKWSLASLNGSSVASLSFWMTRRANPGGVLMPVPTAVPPKASSAMRGSVERRRVMPFSTCVA
jgi:hypothetical protein